MSDGRRSVSELDVDDPSAPEGATIEGLGHSLRKLFQAKRWNELGAATNLEDIWLFDAPVPVAEALEQARARLGDQVEVVLRRIQRTTADDDRASGTYTCLLMWVDLDTWRQVEIEFDLHLGFRRSEGLWSLEYLGITSPTEDKMLRPFDETQWGRVPDGADPSASKVRIPADLAVGPTGDVVVYVPFVLSEEDGRRLLEGARLAAGPARRDSREDVGLGLHPEEEAGR